MEAGHLDEIESLFAELSGGRQELDFQLPVLASHAEHYAAEPDRLRAYAKQVVNARIMIFIAFSRMNTQALLETYLLGVEAQNPFPMLLAARSQLELLSVTADTTRIITENAGEHAEAFVQRVRTVEEALIGATFGTRSAVVKEFLSKEGVGRLPAATQGDFDVLKSKNVLTRLERLSKSGQYPECKDDYERLCEYVHPNFGMNMLHVVASPVNVKLLRFSLASEEPFKRALLASAGVMARAAQRTLAVMSEIQPPFGMGTVSSVV